MGVYPFLTYPVYATCPAPCFGQIIAELKVCEGLSGIEEAQLLNYMKATGNRVGLLINFGSRVRLEWKRYVI